MFTCGSVPSGGCLYGLLTGGILMCFEADALLGHTALKRRLLEASGWTIIPLSHQEVKHALGSLQISLLVFSQNMNQFQLLLNKLSSFFLDC